MIRLDHFHDQTNQRDRREELDALLARAHRKLAQEVLVDLAEDIALRIRQIEVQRLQQRDQQVGLEGGVVLGQHAAQVVVLVLDGLHRGVDDRADIRAFRQFQEMGEASLVAQKEHAARLIGGVSDRTSAASTARFAAAREFLLGLLELVIGIAQEDQPQHGHRILRRFQLGVGAQIVGGLPQAFFDFGGVGGHKVPEVTGSIRCEVDCVPK